MARDDAKTEHLLGLARDGDQDAINQLLRQHRSRLAKMIRTRLNPRIRARVDESDVVQESYLEAAKRLPAYLADPQAPFFLWLRKITGYKIIDVHRRHLGAEGRNVEHEVSLHDARPVATSISLAAQLLGRLTSPSQAAIKQETRLALEMAINAMDPLDREIIALRHYEELTNQEAAEELNIEQAAASKRFIRALQRLQQILNKLDLIEK